MGSISITICIIHVPIVIREQEKQRTESFTYVLS